jgi:glycosyltransferase involved in cell wall biosynthesis
MIERDHSDLLNEGRLILLNRFVDQATYQDVITALDVVCTPYPRFNGLSSTLLEGVAAGRPILANAQGWSDAVVKRFGLGWTCDVLNHDAFTRAIRTAFDRCDEYTVTPAIERLLAFHAPENFGKIWVAGIRAARGLPSEQPLFWNWVEEALPDSSRRLD